MSQSQLAILRVRHNDGKRVRVAVGTNFTHFTPRVTIR